MEQLGRLSASYESNGDPAIVSSGVGDFGGISYGTYQLSSNSGSVGAFLGWGLKQQGFYRDYARVLVDSGEINSDAFIEQWKELGTIDHAGFKQMQHDYIKHAYYDVAKSQLEKYMFNLDKHSQALKDVVWSASVQYGNGWDDEYDCPNIVRLLTESMRYIPTYQSHWNLSYVDDFKFDYDLINGVYEERKCHPWNSNRNTTNISNALINRFNDEKQDALQMFEQELRERG